MSTYTDLHNQVKENITVDYNNRITTQRVRFLNEQNEFLKDIYTFVWNTRINLLKDSFEQTKNHAEGERGDDSGLSLL